MATDGLTSAEFAELARLPPADAMRWMQGRTGTALTYSWQDMFGEEHSRHFTISCLVRMDLLQSFKDSLGRSVAGDLSRRDWMRDHIKLLQDAGWWGEKQVLDPETGKLVKTRFDPARLKLIYDTNTRQASARGQWERIQRAKPPYLRYITKRDDRVRPLHRTWDNVTLPTNHPFWQTNFPPCGWRCRCRVISVSRREYNKGVTPTGAPMIKTAPETVLVKFINRRTGEISFWPAGVDPGFGDIPAQAARLHALDALVAEKLKSVVPAIANAAQYEGLTLESAAATYAEKARLAPSGNDSKMPPLILAALADAALNMLLPLNLSISKKVPLEQKLIGLEHDGVRHIWSEHGVGGQQEQRERLRGQVPIEPGDIAAFATIFNNASVLKIGNPPEASGSPVVEGAAVFGRYRYEFAVKVNRFLIVPFTLYKWLIKP